MRAVLVFCEGRQDVPFVARSLGVHAGCGWMQRKVAQLPTPFGAGGPLTRGLVARRLELRGVGDRSLQAASHAQPPSFEAFVWSEATDTLYVVTLCTGQDHKAAVTHLLSDLDAVMAAEPPGAYDVTQYAAAFLFDADHEGVDETMRVFRERFAPHFGDLSALSPDAWLGSTTVPVGCFVFHQEGSHTGTLEDHLAPMVRSAWPQRYADAEQYIDRHKQPTDAVSRKEAERQKAIITTAGQFNHPGDPLSVIVGDRKTGLPRSVFEASAPSEALADFLTGAPWRAGEAPDMASAQGAGSE